MLSLDVDVLLCLEIDFNAKMITNTNACGLGERGGHNSLLIILSQKHFIPTHKNFCNSIGENLRSQKKMVQQLQLHS